MGLQGVQACLKRTIFGLFVRFKHGAVPEANEIPIFCSVQTRFCPWGECFPAFSLFSDIFFLGGEDKCCLGAQKGVNLWTTGAGPS